MATIAGAVRALWPARQHAPASVQGAAASQQLLLLVTATQCVLLGFGYCTLGREACADRLNTPLQDTALLQGFPCSGSRFRQAVYVLLRFPYALAALVNYRHPDQWANYANAFYLLRLPLLFLLPHNLYEVAGTAVSYYLRIAPILAYLARGPLNRPGTVLQWLLFNMPFLEVAVYYPATPAPLPAIEAMYAVASTACVTMLSYAYNSRYPDLGFWPPLMILRQALAMCLTTYMAVRWSRNRYGTWYGRPYGRSAAGRGSTAAEASQTLLTGSSLDGGKERKGTELLPEQQRQHAAAGKAARDAGDSQEWNEHKSELTSQHELGRTSDQAGVLELAARCPPTVQPVEDAAATPAPPSEHGTRTEQRVPSQPLSAAQHEPSLPYTERAGAVTAAGTVGAGATEPLRQVAAIHPTAANHTVAGADVSTSAGGGDGMTASIRRTVSTAAAVKTRPRYRGVVSYRTTVLKIPGYHPSDIPPGFVQRLAQVLEQQPQHHCHHQQQQQQQGQQQLNEQQATKSATGGGAAAPDEGQNAFGGGGVVRLKAAYAREGCIELGLYLEERAVVGGGVAGGGIAGGPGQQGWQGGEQEADTVPYRAPEDGGMASAAHGVRVWELDPDSGVYRLLPAAAAGSQRGGALERRVQNILGALRLPQRDAPSSGPGAEAGAQQQGQGKRESRSSLGEAGHEEHMELVAMDASPRVVLVGGDAGAGPPHGAVAAPIRFQLVLVHRAPKAGVLAVADAPKLTAQLILMQQQQRREGEEQEGRCCRAVPCRVTLQGVDAAGAAEMYGSASVTIRTVYDVEADLGGMACGPGPAELHVRHNGVPAGGVPLLIAAQRAVAEEVGAAAAEAAAEALGQQLQQQQQQQLQQDDEQDSEDAGGQLGGLLWDLGTWEACIAALPTSTTAGGGSSGKAGPDVQAAAVVGRQLLQHAEACGWEGTAGWVRQGLGRLLGEGQGLGEQATGSQAQVQQLVVEQGRQGFEAGGDLRSDDACGRTDGNAAGVDEASGAEGERQHAAREEEGGRRAGCVELLRQTWLGVEPAGFLEQSFQVFETVCFMLVPLGDAAGGYRMRLNVIINSGLGALVLLSRAFLTHGSWARLVASYRLPRYLSYIAAKLATAAYGLPVARPDLMTGPVQLIFDGVLLPICCPLSAPLAVPLALLNAAALWACTLYVQQQQQQWQGEDAAAATLHQHAMLAFLGRPPPLLVSHDGVLAAAIVALRLAVTALLSIAFVSGLSNRSGSNGSSSSSNGSPGAVGSGSGADRNGSGAFRPPGGSSSNGGQAGSPCGANDEWVLPAAPVSSPTTDRMANGKQRDRQKYC